MKTLLSYFKNYFTKDFHLVSHLIVLIFIGICIALNYGYSIYPTHFRVKGYSELGLLKLWSMHGFAFLTTVGIIALFAKQNKATFPFIYIALGLFALFLVSVDSSYYLIYYGKQLLDSTSSAYPYFYKLMANGMSLISIIIPCFLVYSLVTKFHPELYGLKRNGANIKPYFWIVLLMIPVIFIASLIDDSLLAYYPTYSKTLAAAITYPEWMKVGLYELFYGFDFISVELVYRGFMVVALSKFAGKHTILPMVTCYAFLHFGKPMVETIGSVFGGFALGILAYESRNIYGGITVHLGVAFTMEFVAFLAKS